MVPPFAMSMDARMMLAKMSVIFEREKGTRVKLSEDSDVVGLINYGWETLNHEYLRYFERFCNLLAPSEVQELEAKGAQLYRGAQVRERDEPNPAELKGKVTYRGTPIGGSKPEAVASDQDAPESPAPKGKRVYRGRVIED